MPMFVMLATLTEKGREDIKGIAERRDKNIEELQADGIRIVADFALMGDYDFMYVVETDSHETLLRRIVKDTGSGRLVFKTMLAVPLEQFEQMAKQQETKS